MKKKASIGLVGLVGAGLLGGGLLASALANVSAESMTVGQAELNADCLTAATAQVNFDTNPTYLDGDWRTEAVQMTITDEVNPIACDALPVEVIAYDANGDALQSVNTFIDQTGAGIDQSITFDPYLTAGSIVGYGVNITED